jgi:hypothetical protein
MFEHRLTGNHELAAFSGVINQESVDSISGCQQKLNSFRYIGKNFSRIVIKATLVLQYSD